ncbi:MAG: DUF309 domain-containing protein [Ardenticatenia bacterium]|nr:DUF309 domain-containing protein [Ardenticatenia bacterium]
MSARLEEHLRHIREHVVPARRATRERPPPEYVADVEGRLQPPLLLRGLEQWNAGRFYAQHETLEWFWRALDEPVRDVIKGIIMAGVGAYHALRHNRRGALAKWTGALGYLEPFAGARPYGLDVDVLRADLEGLYRHLGGEPQPDWAQFGAHVRALRLAFERRPAAPRVTDLLRSVDRAWEEGPHALWPALESLPPLPPAHPLWAHVVALGAHKADVAYRLLGRPALNVPAPETWAHLLRGLEVAHEHFREGVGFLEETALDKAVHDAGHTVTLWEAVQTCVEADVASAGMLRATALSRDAEDTAPSPVSPQGR